MPAQTQTVTHVPIDEANIRIRKTESGGYTAVLWMNDEMWSGEGPKIAAAVESVLEAVRAETRTSEYGRPTDRYRIAQSAI